MRRSDFRFHLPSELIAQEPLPDRSGSRLLVLDGPTGKITDRRFDELPDLLQPGDLLVLNDTRVLPARFLGRKDSGGRVEVLVERVLDDHRALAHVRASRAPVTGTGLALEETERATVTGREGALFVIRFDQPVREAMEACGRTPLPPYIEREAEPADRLRYQTVFGRHDGAVAAPTAGLHFDEPLLERLRERGVETTFVTLHVGAGTFQPVREEDLDAHVMHAEELEVPETACEAVAAARERGGRVVAVGTTVVRCLETAADEAGVVHPYRGETDIFIRPGYRFRAVNALVTNFHLPESTLLMLVCAFSGYDNVMAAYRHAVEERYRFFSYGDAMFLTRK